MPLNPNSLLAQLSPIVPIDFGSGPRSMQRQNLELMKQKFEEEKRWHQQQAENDRLAAQAQLAGKAIERQKAQEEAAAKAQAVALERQKNAELDFAKSGGAMNVEQMQAMVPYLESLGTGVDQLGQVGGLPSYRIYDKAQDQARQDQEWQRGAHPIDNAEGEQSAVQSLSLLDGMGYPTNDRGQLDEPAGIGSTEDAFNRAKEAQQNAAEAGGLAARAPDEEDYMGAVPKDVIDLGAMHAQTLARLNPALQAATSAYTDPTLRGQAEQSAKLAAESGLPMDKALELYQKNQETHDSTYRTGLALEAQQAKFRETRDDLTEKDKARMRKEGRFAAEQRAKDDDVQGGVKALRTIDEMQDILDNEGPGSKEDDTMIAGALMSIQDVKGIPSDKDLAFAFGMGKASAITQVISKIQELAQGGFSDPQRAAIKNFIARVKQSQEEKIDLYLDTSEPGMLGDMNEHEQQGYQGTAKRLIPGFYYNRWADKRKGKAEDDGGEPRPIGSNTGRDPEFDKALDEQARSAGYDPDKLRAIIGPESGGSSSATSSAGAKGAFQLMPDRAKAAGTSSEELAKMTAAEQVPSGIKYLQSTSLKGDAPLRDYALAFAAPAYIGKSDDTVIEEYRSNTAFGKDVRKKNPGWIPKDGGEITVGSIADFYHARGSGKGKERKADAGNPYNDEARKLIEKMRGG